MQANLGRMSGDNPYSKKSAIVLDDNQQMRGIMRSILSSMGIRMIAEYSEPEPVLYHLRGQRADIAVIDLVLNAEFDGLELAEAIRHDSLVVNPTMPIILVTGYPSVSVIEQTINCGVDELVTKPLRARDLIARVEKLLTKPRAYIRTPSGYFGPDRRRRNDPYFLGPDRRKEDLADVVGQKKPNPARAKKKVKPDAFVEQRTVDESIIILD